MTFEMPEPNDRKKVHDLDLGDDHWLDWTTYKDQRCGGIITHKTQTNDTGLCSASFWIIKIDFMQQNAIWSLSGDDQKPTLSPSFLCHCGDHGFIHKGKWVRA